MDLNKSILAIEKFNGNNFPTWQTKIRLLLMREGSWNVVKGTEPRLRGEEATAAVTAWDDKNDKALAYIGLGLHDNHIHHLDS